ncbi:MAG: hypothetical protein ABJN96_06085 [Marinomonas sp.]
MNMLENIFPESPSFKGAWHAIYLEPIIGSGERITVAVAAISSKSEFSVIQAIRSELLDCLYGVQSQNIQNMINWLIDSAITFIRSTGGLESWKPPFEGVVCTNATPASDNNIDGILRQAIRFSASLSTLSLDAERDNDDLQPRRYASQWATHIADELNVINPFLTPYLKQKVKIGDSGLQTAFGFLNDKYVSNFALLIPSNLSSSLTSVKAKILDLENLQKSKELIKPEKFELIIGTPSFSDPTLSNRSLTNLKRNIDLVKEIAEQEKISVFNTDNANQAAQQINKSAA